MSSLIAFHHIFWDRSWVWGLPFWLAWLASEWASGSACSHLPLSWVYIDPGDLNLGPHACSIITHCASPQSSKITLKSNCGETITGSLLCSNTTRDHTPLYCQLQNKRCLDSWAPVLASTCLCMSTDIQTFIFINTFYFSILPDIVSSCEFWTRLYWIKSPLCINNSSAVLG